MRGGQDQRKRDYRGYLITLEGGEGSGKTTHIPEIASCLRSLGFDPVVTREPGGTEIGDDIRSILLDDKHKSVISLRTEVSLFQANRSQVVDQVIMPSLKEGKIVLVDRYADSSLAYQGYGRGVGCGFIGRLNDFSTGGLVPDLTILFDVDPEIGMSRRKNCEGEFNRLDAEELDFHKKVNFALRELAMADRMFSENPRWEIVDANLELDEVEMQVLSVVGERLLRAGFLESLGGRVERR